MPRKKYSVDDIIKMEEIDHIRKNQGMYVGDSEDATRLLEEVLDNSLDEVQAGFADILGVFINTKNNSFKVLDNGRGIPFDEKLPIDKDPPVLICNSLFTSGKFNKGENSVYKIASGLHGVGLTCVRALSENMSIEIFNNSKHATYTFKHDGSINRVIEEADTNKKPFSTKTEVFPAKKYFNKPSININKIKERLEIASVAFPKLKIIFKINDTPKLINITEDVLIKNNLGKDITSNWITFENNNKSGEYCSVKFQWVEKGAPKSFGIVNLCNVNEGAHITKFYNILKKIFSTFSSKYKLEFEPADCLVGLRLFINLRILNISFSEQVKDRLASRTDLTIMEELEEDIEKYFKKNEPLLLELLNSFYEYRQDINHKKLTDNTKTTSRNKRGFSTFTKLRDCSQEGGELIIGEGDSAIGGLIQTRDPKKHAVLPLKGVIPNVINKKDFYNNNELKDIITACGCGIGKNCDVSKLRYNKIILAADADPAGHWITALLITLFAYTMDPVIKEGKLYVCKTPLYGYKNKTGFIPLWSDAEIEEAIKNKESIIRFKGLGEFNPKDLKVFILNESTRKLIKVQWSEKNHEKLFDLMSNSEEKRKLALGEWTIK